VVPVMAMIRARAAASTVDTRLLFSSRSWEDVVYREQLERLGGDALTVVHTPDAVAAAGLDGLRALGGRRDARQARPDPAELPGVYICGSTPFVEASAEALVQLGHEPHRVKTERSDRREGERWTH
jgi:ferredoxin-NADP reductase